MNEALEELRATLGWGGVWLGKCLGCGWGRIGGVAGERLRASEVQMGLKSYVFAGGKKFERKWMTG